MKAVKHGVIVGCFTLSAFLYGGGAWSVVKNSSSVEEAAIKEDMSFKKFIRASKQGAFFQVKACIDAGVDVNEAREKDGCTSLMLASKYGHKKVVKKLLAVGAGVSKKNNNGRSALGFAALKSHMHVMKLLLEHGADPFEKDRGGHTILNSIQGHPDLLHLGLRYAANKAKKRCPLCFYKIKSPEQFEVGSHVYNCYHFICKPCKKRWSNSCPVCREF